MTTITEDHVVTLTSGVCSECGVLFGLPENYRAARRRDHQTFYCPNGHTQYYPQNSTEEVLKQRLRWAEAREKSWKDQAETAENRRRAQKAVTTRIKNRIANGVCPCCNRSFANLRDHMTGQHPNYTEK